VNDDWTFDLIFEEKGRLAAGRGIIGHRRLKRPLNSIYQKINSVYADNQAIPPRTISPISVVLT
jgi:hypothetical protein